MEKIINKIAQTMAISGGMVLISIIILTCISVIGRGLNTLGHSEIINNLSKKIGNMIIETGVAPVTGDFEIVEVGVAFAIFAFLPICQWQQRHATVDVVTAKMSDKINKILITIWDTTLTIITILIAQRLYAGMNNKIEYGETTFLLQFPIWWAYAICLIAASGAVIVGVYCSSARIVELVKGER